MSGKWQNLLCVLSVKHIKGTWNRGMEKGRVGMEGKGWKKEEKRKYWK